MINIEDYGFEYKDVIEASDIPARITAVHKERYTMVCKYGEIKGILKSGLYFNGSYADFPAVGDFVLINYNDKGDSLIIKTLPRKSYFTRSNNFGKLGEQAIAANFDYVFILMSLNKDFNIARLERYMAIAWQSGGIPGVILTKADLCQDAESYVAEAESSAPGVDVISVSALTRDGIDRIKSLLRPRKTAIFLGSSGVGKSTLINCIAEEELMKTGDIRQEDSKGRHTTTYRQLIMTKEKFMIIDTPGMREIGLWDAMEGLSEAFLDISALEKSCRFSDCTHTKEPGCAIIEALENGSLSPDRWKNYQKLKNENLRSEDKMAYLRMWREKIRTMEKSQRHAYKNRNKR